MVAPRMHASWQPRMPWHRAWRYTCVIVFTLIFSPKLENIEGRRSPFPAWVKAVKWVQYHSQINSKLAVRNRKGFLLNCVGWLYMMGPFFYFFCRDAFVRRHFQPRGCFSRFFWKITDRKRFYSALRLSETKRDNENKKTRRRGGSRSARQSPHGPRARHTRLLPAGRVWNLWNERARRVPACMSAPVSCCVPELAPRGAPRRPAPAGARVLLDNSRV